MTREQSLKLKEGDFVVAMNIPYQHLNKSFISGEIYEIGGEFYENSYPKYIKNTIAIKKDSEGNDNGWYYGYFEVACKATKILFGVE